MLRLFLLLPLHVPYLGLSVPNPRVHSLFHQPRHPPFHCHTSLLSSLADVAPLHPYLGL